MGRFLDLAMLLFGFQATSVWSQRPADKLVNELHEPPKSANLDVSITASFPASEVFGIKLVNGKPTQALLSLSNNEPQPVVLAFVGGALWTPEYGQGGSQLLRNLSTVQYGMEIPAGEKESIQFNFVTELHPQELRLNLVAIVGDGDQKYHSIPAFNGTVSVVEQDTSFFDPQVIFLYLFLLATFVGVGYAFYAIWIQPYFAPKRGTRSGAGGVGSGDRRRTKKEPLAVQPPTENEATATGAKVYNEEWIPAHHIQRPEARRVKSGTPRPKSRGKAE